MKKLALLGLLYVAGTAHAAATLTSVSGKYTLALDYIDVLSGGSKLAYKASLTSFDLSSFNIDLATVALVATNSAADPSTTPRLLIADGAYLLEIPSIAVDAQTYAVTLGGSDVTRFSVDAGSLRSVSGNRPSNVAIGNADSQTVGGRTIAASTQLAVSWTAPVGAPVLSSTVVAREVDGVGEVSASVSGTVSAVTLTGLKAATDYAVNVTACFNAACTSQATAAAVTATTPDEYWQLQGTGNSYTTLTQAVGDGTSLSWVMRWGTEAGPSYAGRYQYFYKSNTVSSRGIGIATTSASTVDVATLTSFAANASAGLRNPCEGPQSTTGCPSDAAYFINAIQAVPLAASGKVRVFFEAIDATEAGQPTRIYSLDSQDGLVGQDFNSASATAYCGGNGSTDYMGDGPCAPTTEIGVSTDIGSAKSPLNEARQFKIGWDWLADWRWDGASGTFMIITGDDACGSNPNALYYATWDGSKWSVATDASGCAKPLVTNAHGPVVVPLGGAKYKVYYEDQTNGTQSGKPLRFIYADGSWSAAAGTVDIDDWEASSQAREVHFLWPDGSLLNAQEEAGLGDHMVIAPEGTLDKQYMFVNLGGFDNSSWNAVSSGLGVAVLLNP